MQCVCVSDKDQKCEKFVGAFQIWTRSGPANTPTKYYEMMENFISKSLKELELFSLLGVMRKIINSVDSYRTWWNHGKVYQQIPEEIIIIF